MSDDSDVGLPGQVSRRRARGLVSPLALVLIASVSGCGNASHSHAAPARVIDVTERDFRIGAPMTVPAGRVVLRDHNRGPDMHELIVIRSQSGRLPMRGDGYTVDEDGLAKQEAGALEPGQPGSVRELAVTLKPGRYVLMCNMSGHYLGGMRSVLVVT